MTEAQKSKCSVIIHASATAATGVATGMAQLPGSDNFPLAAIEIAMVTKIGNVFGKSLTKSAAEGIIASVAGATVGRTISQALIGWWPGVGNMINGATAASVVEAIGWGAVKYFDE